MGYDIALRYKLIIFSISYIKKYLYLKLGNIRYFKLYGI
jgi:hypothetical protein